MYKHIISLGEDCFMRTMVHNFSLRELYSTRMPFDGSIHPYGKMCSLIETDFKDYYLGLAKKQNKKVYWSLPGGIILNHEQIDVDETSLKAQLDIRINQFLEVLSTSEKNKDGVLFLIHPRPKKWYGKFDITPLRRAIKLKYPNLSYHVFICNTFNTTEDRYGDDDYTYCDITWKSPGTQQFWQSKDLSSINNRFIDEVYKTLYGVSFSKLVLKEICSILGESTSKYNLNNHRDPRP